MLASVQVFRSDVKWSTLISMHVQVTSELDRLNAIVIHRPGPELDLMTPANIEAYAAMNSGVIEKNPDYLLFDDLVLLSKLRAEHNQIVSVLRATCGHEQTFELRDLLRTLLDNSAARKKLVDSAIALESTIWGNQVAETEREVMLSLDSHNLVKTLVRGTTASGTRILKWPLPNLLFARDLAAVVGKAVLLTYAQKPARKREMCISRALFEFHPRFESSELLDIGPYVSDPALEGGDIIVLDSERVAIGVSERTNMASARAAANLLLKSGIQCVYLVALQQARSTMHLDTVFTMVDHESCLAFGPLLLDGAGVTVTSIEAPNRERQRTGSWLDILAEDGLVLKPIRCGGTDPIHQEREQWSDGANAFALAPGKILLYARNEKTLSELNRVGFEVLTPEEFCRNAALVLGNNSRRVVVAIEGSELSRGRGGPRCLTLPISRGS